MDDFVTDILKERIRDRMDRLGKNPSSVALEAGLSRSAVRDILSGKAKNPGVMTIYRIADALECSHSYLMGWVDELHYSESPDILIDINARTYEISGVLEAGVFKQITDSAEKPHDSASIFDEPAKFGHRERKPFRSKRRYIHRDLFLYRMGDSSLDGLHIAKGDLIVAVHDPERPGPKNGEIVIVSHRIPGINAEELSARVVERSGTSITFRAASTQTIYAPIIVGESVGDSGAFRTVGGGSVVVEGIAVELTRQLDVGFISPPR